MFEVSRVSRNGAIVAYMYQWDRIPYDTFCVLSRIRYDLGDMGVRVRPYAMVWGGGVWVSVMNEGVCVIFWADTLCYDRVVN